MKKKFWLSIILICFGLLNFVFAQNINHPKVKWKFKTNGTIRGDATIYEDKIYFGSSDGFVYALNKEDACLKWKSPTNAPIVSSPSIHKESLFIVNRDNFVYSMNLKDGHIQWKFELEKTLPQLQAGWDYFMASPIVYNNKIFVGSGDGHLYAIDASTGKLLWKFKTNGRIRATPLIHEGNIYQASNDGFVYVIDAKKGQEKWKFETKGAKHNSVEAGFDRNSIFTQAIIHDDLLIIGSRDGNVYGIDIQTQKEKWSFSYGPTWVMSTSLEENTLFVGWSTNNLACALDVNTGEEIWQFNSDGHVYDKLLPVQSDVYIGSANGKLYQLDKKSGKKKWEYNIGSEIYSSPISDGQTLYLGSDDGFYYAIEEGQDVFKAVYHPNNIEGNAQYLIVDKAITPYLKEKDFSQLDSASLYQFLEDRISDKAPSVIVFSLPLIPHNMIGDHPKEGMIRQYLNTGGKIVWFGDIPNFYEPDESGNFKRDSFAGSQLLEVEFKYPRESGNYFSKATQMGLNWGLPKWIKTTGTTVQSDSVTPLAYDEFGRVSLWLKKFNARAGSGFISCRTWSWNIAIKDSDLELVHQIALHGLH